MLRGSRSAQRSPFSLPRVRAGQASAEVRFGAPQEGRARVGVRVARLARQEPAADLSCGRPFWIVLSSARLHVASALLQGHWQARR